MEIPISVVLTLAYIRVPCRAGWNTNAGHCSDQEARGEARVHMSNRLPREVETEAAGPGTTLGDPLTNSSLSILNIWAR